MSKMKMSNAKTVVVEVKLAEVEVELSEVEVELAEVEVELAEVEVELAEAEVEMAEPIYSTDRSCPTCCLEPPRIREWLLPPQRLFPQT